jgi:small subunit ribosomal protein S7
MRRPIKNKPVRRPDLVYQSEAVSRFINTVMLDGKKDTARKVVYDALDLIKKGEGEPDSRLLKLQFVTSHL